MSSLRSLALALALCACGKPEALPTFGQVPAFTLRDQAGHAATRKLFDGKVSLVDFIFTSCPDVCPLLTQQMAELRRRLPADGALSFVSFSVDPEHDTPQRLTDFAKQHGALQSNWWFLTGDVDQVKRVVTAGFKQAMDAQPTGPGKPANVLHGTHFVLVDRRGEIRGFYRSDADQVEPLMAAVKDLMAEGAAP